MKNIVFDFWGTLGYLVSGPDFGKKIADLLKIEKQVYSRLVREYWFRQALSSEEFADLLKEKTNSEAEVSDLVKWINSPLKRARLYKGVIPNLERLSQKKKLYIVSDTSTIGEEIIKRLGIESYFAGIGLSCNFGLVKSEGLYSMCFDKFHIRLEQTLVIGDTPELDFKIPQQMGMEAVLVDRRRKIEGYKTVKSLDEIK